MEEAFCLFFLSPLIKDACDPCDKVGFQVFS